MNFTIDEYNDNYYFNKKSSKYIKRPHEKEATIIKKEFERNKKKLKSLIQRKKSNNIIRKFVDFN